MPRFASSFASVAASVTWAWSPVPKSMLPISSMAATYPHITSISDGPTATDAKPSLHSLNQAVSSIPGESISVPRFTDLAAGRNDLVLSAQFTDLVGPVYGLKSVNGTAAQLAVVQVGAGGER